jgi:hypothetical protein
LRHILPQCSKARAESEQLGTLRSLRRKLYEHLRRYQEQFEKQPLDSSIASQLEALERVMDLIYRYLLKAPPKRLFGASSSSALTTSASSKCLPIMQTQTASAQYPKTLMRRCLNLKSSAPWD